MSTAHPLPLDPTEFPVCRGSHRPMVSPSPIHQTTMQLCCGCSRWFNGAALAPLHFDLRTTEAERFADRDLR